MEHRLLYDTFVIGSLLVMLQSDCLPVPAKTAKPNDGEWWGVIGSVFVLSISEFKWILRFKIQVRLFYHLQAPHGDNFELFVSISSCLYLYQKKFVLLLFCKKRNKMQYDNQTTRETLPM